MPKKKVSKKSSAKPKLCLRQIDKTTQLICADPQFPIVPSSKKVTLPKGYKRVDASTVVKV